MQDLQQEGDAAHADPLHEAGNWGLPAGNRTQHLPLTKRGFSL
jgi:hypothetical protein